MFLLKSGTSLAFGEACRHRWFELVPPERCLRVNIRSIGGCHGDRSLYAKKLAQRRSISFRMRGGLAVTAWGVLQTFVGGWWLGPVAWRRRERLRRSRPLCNYRSLTSNA